MPVYRKIHFNNSAEKFILTKKDHRIQISILEQTEYNILNKYSIIDQFYIQ